jgi:hypothetical protein
LTATSYSGGRTLASGYFLMLILLCFLNNWFWI